MNPLAIFTRWVELRRDSEDAVADLVRVFACDSCGSRTDDVAEVTEAGADLCADCSAEFYEAFFRAEARAEGER
jgi:hypothetical protein